MNHSANKKWADTRKKINTQSSTQQTDAMWSNWKWRKQKRNNNFNLQQTMQTVLKMKIINSHIYTHTHAGHVCLCIRNVYMGTSKRNPSIRRNEKKRKRSKIIIYRQKKKKMKKKMLLLKYLRWRRSSHLYDVMLKIYIYTKA